MKTKFSPIKLALIIMVLINCASALLAEAPAHQPCTVVTATSNSSDVPKAIPVVGTVTSDLIVSSPSTYILDVDLNANIEHTFAADLDVKLKSPGGTQVTITTDNGSGNDNVFNGTLFDDQAEKPVTDHVYVNTILASPLVVEGALGKFKGEDPNGTWTLEIVDDLTGDSGNLTAWSLDITVCEGNIPGDTKLDTYSSTGPVNIIDNNLINPAFSAITVANHPGKICNLELFTNITHTFSADMDITLEAPDGKKTTISTDNGAGNDNVFSNTNFRDSGATTVTDTIYVNNVAKDNLVPEGALSKFDGIDANGEWKLIVVDDLGGDTGIINSWSLTIKTCGTDEDQDNVSDDVDNCPDIPNTIQTDNDSDGFGDACDECSDDPNKSSAGTCGCGIVDVDTDSDGTFDCNETCVSDPNKTSPGACGCGTPDTDSNANSIADCLLNQEMESHLTSLRTAVSNLKKLGEDPSAKKKKKNKVLKNAVTAQLDITMVFGNTHSAGISVSGVDSLSVLLESMNKAVKKARNTKSNKFKKNKKAALTNIDKFLDLV